MKRIVMVGTSLDTQGGVSAVVRTLKDAGLFDLCDAHYIPTHGDGTHLTKLAVAVRGLTKYLWLLVTGQVALLHLHTASRASFWRKSFFILPAVLARVPVVIHLHGAEFHLFYERECPAAARRFVRWIFERAERVIVLSESWRNWANSVFPQARIRVVPNPVSMPTQSQSSQRATSSILFLGQIGKRKGVYDLLEAASRLAAGLPDLRVLLGGDGELDAVRERAKILDIAQHVELLGWVHGAKKERLLGQATIFVLPSYNEGLPMSVLEAMAHGLPVVSTTVGGIPEAVADGVEGFLVQPGDIDALADRLQRLLNDGQLRARMAAAARRKAEDKFGAVGVVRKIMEIYEEIGVCRQCGQG